MLRRTQKESDDGDDRYVQSRAEDRSFWIRAAYTIDKYKILVWLGGSILIAFGFGFQTPASKFEEIHKEIAATRTIMQNQVDTLRINVDQGVQDRRQIRSQTQFITRFICSKMTADDKYRLGGTDACASAAHDASNNYIH